MNEEYKKTLTAGWLSQFPRSFAEAVLSHGTLLKTPRGTTLYNIDDDQPCLYGVVSGSLRFVITMNEQPPRFAHLIGPGGWFGENELALRKSAMLEVTSAQDATLLRLTQVQFDAVAAAQHVAWRAIAALSSMNVALAVGAVDDLMIPNPRQRLCAVLLRLAARRNAFQGQPRMDVLYMTQTDLSVAAVLSRSKTAEVIGSLVSAGAVETIYGGLKIVDAAILERELAM